nr:helix-turn-helix transcriptional regulator [Nonlabens ulvanivorans]
MKSIKKELPSIVSILGENIRMIRKQNNKSIEEVAFKAEIDAQNLRKYELGKQEMKIGMLKRIALALDMSMSELLKIVESKQEA